MTNLTGKENCMKCSKQVTGKQENLECNQCHLYLHLTCSNQKELH